MTRLEHVVKVFVVGVGASIKDAERVFTNL